MTFKRVRHLAGFTIKPLLGVMFVLGALMPAAPAGAIVGGQPDGNGHPYVGFLDASPIGRPDGPTGVLISPTVLLTAGHVTQSFAARGLTHPRVTFEPVAGTASTWYTGTVHTNPAYDPQRADDPGDLGVVVLDRPVTGITPAALPTAGLLDALGPSQLSDATFTVVGYGASRLLGGSNGGGPPQWDPYSGGTRTAAEQSFLSLTPGWLRVQEHEDGQICVGDSGSPTLFAGSNVIAGITTAFLGGLCQNSAGDERVDTPAARAFLGQYVTLP
jgi:V8-like Glu-specific endopeptidase